MSMRVRKLSIMAVAALSTSACSFTGVNSQPLPFEKGSRNSLEVTVVLQNATNLVPNSEVKYRDVTVGSVRRVKLGSNWTAQVIVGIEKAAHVPDDVIADVAQKSLLGAEYLDLKDPNSTDASEPLKAGSVIGLNRTGRYPETEEVLTAAAALFNGGGLPQLSSIETELNTALNGHVDQVKSLVSRIDEFSRTLNSQQGAIDNTLTQLNRLSVTVNSQSDAVDRALTDVPKGLRVLADERKDLVDAITAVSNLETTARTVLAGNQGKLQQVLNDLAPITGALANAGPKLSQLLELTTFPFPLSNTTRILHSDYVNLGGLIRLDVPELLKNFLGSTALDGLYTAFIKGTPTGPAVQSHNPLSVTGLPTPTSAASPTGPKNTPTTQQGGQSAAPGQPNPGAPAPSSSASQPSLLGVLGSLLGGK